MLIVIFRSHLRSDADLTELDRIGQRMYELASAMPGFLSYKDFAASDGESLTLVEFKSAESLLAWRNQPEHRIAQERARAEFFSDYHITVCEPKRAYRYSGEEGRLELMPAATHD